MQNCLVCSSPIKTVPAGFSQKTGKAYNAFQVCSNRECNWRPPQTPKSTPPATVEDMRAKFLIEVYKKCSSRQDIETDLQMLLDIYARKPVKTEIEEDVFPPDNY